MSFRYTTESETVSKVYFDELYVGTISQRGDGSFSGVASGGKQFGPFDSFGKAFDSLAVHHVWRQWPHPMQGTPKDDGWYLVWVRGEDDWTMLELSGGGFDCTVDYWLPLPPKPGAIFKQ